MGFALSAMQLTSPAFGQGERIPKRNSREGEDLSPALSWNGVPEGTRSLALVCHDPDAPLVTGQGTYGFVHWVLYGIPATAAGVPEGVRDYLAGTNDFGETGYGGPMPPEGHGVHNYFFWVLALDKEPELEPGLTMWELLARVEPHLIGMNRLVGTYERT